MYPKIFCFLFLAAIAESAGVSLKEDCSDDANVLATIAPDSTVEVRSSMAGYSKPCYAVTVTVDGKAVKGYVLGATLPAIAEFEQKRAAYAASARILPPPQAVAPVDPAAPAVKPAAAPIPAPKQPDAAGQKPGGAVLPNFSSTDMKNRPVSLHSLKGKINLVCFWSPSSPAASRELLVVSRLFGQFRKQGVDAMAVSLSANQRELADTLDDYHLGFANLPRGYTVAGQLGIAYSDLPRTYVLNDRFEVIASGVHGSALEALVRKLVAGQ